MATTIPQNIIINRSTLNDVQGDYNYFNVSPGTYGIHRLFEASCPAAFHDSAERSPPPRCLAGTRVRILREISDWISESDEKILWVSGPAGTGKSAISQTIAETCAGNSALAGAFFFFRGAPGRDSTDRLAASITYQIATKVPEKSQELGAIIERDLSILYKPFNYKSWSFLFSTPH